MDPRPRVPVIDITALADEDPIAHDRCVATIGAACRDLGFFTIVGHGLDPVVRDAGFAAARRFFAAPDALKALVAMDHDGPGAERGWDGVGRQRLDDAAPADSKESFNVGPATDAAGRLGTDDRPMRGADRWPDDAALPGFRRSVEQIRAALAPIARRVLRAVAEAATGDADAFEPHCTEPHGALRLTRYPGDPSPPPGAVGAGGHTDWGALTVLAQDGIGGLEVRDPHGRWIPVVPDPEALVVNIGDLIDHWTNGAFRSTPHRVTVPTSDRYSIVLFHDLDWDAPVSALAQFCGPGRPAPPADTSVGEHLLRKFRASVVAGQ